MSAPSPRARGARVIGTASEANHEFLRSLGAEPTTYGDGMVQRIRALALAAAGRLSMPVRTFTFAEAGDAHRISFEGHVRGKLVLIPG